LKDQGLRAYLASFAVLKLHLIPHTRRLRSYLGVLLVVTVIRRLVLVAIPLILGNVINDLGETIPWKLIALYLGAQFLGSQSGLGLIHSFLLYRVHVDMTIALQRSTYDHIMGLSADFHDAKKSSVLWESMRRADDVVDLLKEALFSILPNLFDLVLAIIVLTVVFGFYMTFIVAATGILFYWMYAQTMITRTAMQWSWLDAYYDQHYQLTESTSNWDTVTQFGQIPSKKQRYRGKGDATRGNLLVL
jgi:ABC-type bacteriocin/lantibiotic exporter with double-glycine peptidase domain